MKRRQLWPALTCLVLISAFSVGCCSSWEFNQTNKKFEIVKVNDCAGFYPLDYKVKWGDTVVFDNHAGTDIILEFPRDSVTASDEDPSTPDIVEVKVKKCRQVNITFIDDPQTPPRTDDLEIDVRIKDPCHGGAKIIIQPANS